MRDFDVIVSGAGPAGCCAAKALAEKGLETLVLELEGLPREKPCAGWVNPRVCELLGLDTSSDVFVPVHRAAFFSASGNFFEHKSDEPFSYGVVRSEFDNLLAGLARDAGAFLMEKTPVTGFSVERNGVSVFSGKKVFKSDLLVGADGAQGMVARKVRGRTSCLSTLTLGVVSEFDCPWALKDSNFVEIFQEPSWGAEGWFFPKKGKLNMGVAGYFSIFKQRGFTIKKVFEDLVARLKKVGRLPSDFSPPVPSSWIYPSGSLDKTFDERVLLAGDAGGFPNLVGAEGIRQAVVSGLLCAETAGLAFEEEDFSRDSLARYEDLWKKTLGKEYVKRRGFGDRELDLLVWLIRGDREAAKLAVDLVLNGEIPSFSHLISFLPGFFARKLSSGFGRIFGR